MTGLETMKTLEKIVDIVLQNFFFLRGCRLVHKDRLVCVDFGVHVLHYNQDGAVSKSFQACICCIT